MASKEISVTLIPLSGGKAITLTVPADATVRQLKDAHQESKGIPPAQQNLIFPIPAEVKPAINRYKEVEKYGKGLDELKKELGKAAGEKAFVQYMEAYDNLNAVANRAKRGKLRNASTLAASGVNDGAEILCVLSLRGDTVTLVTNTHEYWEVDAEGSTTLAEIKAGQPKWPVENVRLIYDGHFLKDDTKTLEELGIDLPATIHLLLHMPGTAEPTDKDLEQHREKCLVC